jgi:hypothetical protein
MGKNFVREFRIVKQRNRIEGIDEKEDYDITLAGTENMTEILFENMTKDGIWLGFIALNDCQNRDTVDEVICCFLSR